MIQYTCTCITFHRVRIFLSIHLKLKYESDSAEYK